MTNNCEIILFGDNQYFQCCNENKNIQKLVENKNALPLINVSFYTTPIDYLIKNDEIINKIEARGDSSLIITNKKTIILKEVCEIYFVPLQPKSTPHMLHEK